MPAGTAGNCTAWLLQHIGCTVQPCMVCPARHGACRLMLCSDNEFGYSMRLADLIEHMATVDALA